MEEVTETPEIVNPVKIANKIKGEGTHMFMYGVGGGINTTNLEYMSGYEEYVSGVNTIATADYSIGGFANLADDLANFINELCRTTIQIDKSVLGPVCDDTVVFRFIIYNLGDQSATNAVVVSDTFPSGYTNLMFYGTAADKVCPFIFPCPSGTPSNAIIWYAQPVPPLSSDTIYITATVLPSGNYTNTAWAVTENAATVSDTFPGSQIVYDMPPTITCPANVTISCSASTLPANTGMPVATDPDGPPPTVSYTDVTASGTCPIVGTITRTWSANDGCNPSVFCTQTISLTDITPPVITCPANLTIACQTSTLPAATGTATGIDLCDQTVAITYADVTVAGGCPIEYTINRTWTASDDCGNTSTCVQHIFIDDNESPVLTCTNTNILCSDPIDPSFTGYPMVTNNCGGTSVFTWSDQFVYMVTAPQCSLVRTWTATDNCGNVGTCVQTIVIKDLSGPAIFCPSNVTVECTASTLPGNTGMATSTDNCTLDPAISYADNIVVSPTCPQNKTITRTWTSFDECGNSTSCAQVITVVDDVSPSISCPANITIQCTASTLPAATGSPVSSDNCDAAPDVTYTDVTAAGSCPQKYTITRTWKSTDDCGNFSTCNQTIFINDNVAPTMSCPANITILCTSSTLPENTGNATGTDNCDLSPAVTYTDVTAAGGCPQEYTITRTWKAQDACGNFNTCNQTIFVDDNMPPDMNCPPDLTIECSDSTSPENNGLATATDNCDISPTITHTDVITSGACPQQYIITRTWKAQDHCGNLNTCNQIIVVQDTLAPVMTCPPDLTIECTVNTLPGTTGAATATDNCDISPTIISSDVTVAGPCPQTYTIMRTWTATDDCGHSSTCVQTILVHDTTPPVITCPVNLTIECTESTLPGNTGSATATDACDANVDITYTEELSIPTGCPEEFTITRTWEAVDDCGNSSTCVQVIVIDDSTPPVITCPPGVTIECTESTLPTATGSMTATDNCDPSPAITYEDVTTASPSCPQEYSIARTWTATDTCGNSTTCLQNIVIEDTTSPDITCPPDLTILCTESTLPDHTGSAAATDNCDPSPDVEYDDITMTVPGTNGFVINRTWTATDACGNNATCLQHILVNNPLIPEIMGDPLDTICSGEMVVFEAVDQGISPITYEWSFGSGSSPSSASGIGPHEITYTYNTTNGSVGAWVILTVTTPGCPPVTDTVANVHVNALPNSAITTSPGTPCIFGPKTFQPTAAEVPGYSYQWNFGAGAIPATASGYGPYTVEYSTAGSKTVKLVVWTNEAGASCVDSTTVTFTINTCPGQITGRVFLDTQTTDTVGIANVTVRLYADQNLDGLADNGVIIRTVSTNAQGRYSMASITPGYYVIVELQPSGYFSLWEDDTSEDYDSLSNVVPNDNIIPCTIEPNEIDTRNFFVEVISPGIITGYVFEDFNGDQAPQPAEGIPGVTIDLFQDTNADGLPDGSPVASVMTSSIGFYTIGNMAVGNYVLSEQQPSGYDSVLDIDPTNDGDVVPNTNMMDDLIPVTLTNAEVDAENFFIESTTCNQYVTTTEDNVPGSLRFAIECAQDWDTIFFHPTLANQTLHLNAGRIDINKNLYIYSEINPTVMVNSDNSGAFKIEAGNTVELKGINFTSGLSGYPGAEFENYGHLVLWNCEVFRNSLLPAMDYLIYNHDPGDLTTKGTFILHSN